MFIIGSLIASIATIAFQYGGIKYIEFIAYPIMFIPLLLFASVKSKHNQGFEKGYKLDSSHFGNYNFFSTALIVIISTLAASTFMDITNIILPPMPEHLAELFENILNGQPLIISFISVSIFAPLFEEWLCRGLVLRGILKNGTKPLWAIIISALFFAIIHMNPWQAVPAFALGILFGYVYYKTGSLKLVMLMHFTNNTSALILSKIPAFKDIDTIFEVLGKDITKYSILLVISAIILGFSLSLIKKIPLGSPSGNIDEVNKVYL